MNVVSVNGIEPITAEYAISWIHGARRLRSKKVRTITIQLSKSRGQEQSMNNTGQCLTHSNLFLPPSKHRCLLIKQCYHHLPKRFDLSTKRMRASTRSNMKPQLYCNLRRMQDYIFMECPSSLGFTPRCGPIKICHGPFGKEKS